MNSNNHNRVLAIGIDAAEPSLIREMIQQNELPALAGLLQSGKWLRVKSSAHIGSGSVWPTFITGQEPSKHGVYGEWVWHPDTMSLSRYTGSSLLPFWRDLIVGGLRVGTFDVPFAPFLQVADGFEVNEWGPHDLIEGQLRVSPEPIAHWLATQPTHPLFGARLDVPSPHDYPALSRLTEACIDGIRKRGAVAEHLILQNDPHVTLIVFSEIHHSAHYLWHTVAPDAAIYRQNGFRDLQRTRPALRDVYREVDKQIGRLEHVVGPEATILVFSLHGMTAANGVPSFLQSLLCERGFAELSRWSEKSWKERAIGLMAGAKRRAPKSLKRLYYELVPSTTTIRLAQPTMLAQYDWKTTRAFSLPTDQHGWIQINLKGREATGVVEQCEYEDTCKQLEVMLESLTADDGKRVVKRVFRTARSAEVAVAQRLPDLVIHWSDVAFATPLRINNSGIVSNPVGMKFTGQHGLDGFCIFRGQKQLCEGEVLSAANIHEIIEASLRNGIH